MATVSKAERGPERILAASGVPTEGSRVKWPLGLRLLGSPEAEALKQQAEALFLVAAAQAQLGQVNPGLTRELTRAVQELQDQFREQNRRNPMPHGVSEDTERALTKLKRAPELLEQALTTPAGGYAQLQAAAGSAPAGQVAVVEVGLYDNYLRPPPVTVPAGATVQWTNHGHHRHTVTAEAGQWDSGEVGPGGVYRYTFTRPGMYPYFCTFHPAEMRGAIVVK
jgi:plastocyanin